MKYTQVRHPKYDVLCVGAATWDTLLTGIDPGLFRTDSILAKEYTASSGGDALNTAVSLAKLGLSVSLCAVLGEDTAAELIIQDLHQAGVCTDDLIRSAHVHTASPVLLVDTEGERHIIRVPNSGNHTLTREMISDDLLQKAVHMHVGSANVLPALDGPGLGQLMKRAHELGLTTSMDVSYDKSGKWLQNIEDALYHCDIFIPSLQEASRYCNSTDPEVICAFFRRYPLKVFGIKLGSNGVMITDFRDTYTMGTLYNGIPADTTGAGDAFMAGFIAAWLREYDLPSCMAFGSAQSASVLRGTGANRTAGTLADACRLLEENRIKIRRKDEYISE